MNSISENPSKNPSPVAPVRTSFIVEQFKKIPDGWGGQATKKPAAKALSKLRKILTILESGKMPWPTITVGGNGGFMLTWLSLNRDMMMSVDPDGDVQFATSLKKLDPGSFEIIDRMDSEGIVQDMATIDQMMAWFCGDKSYSA